MSAHGFLILPDVILENYREVDNWVFGEKQGKKFVVDVSARGVSTIRLTVDSADSTKIKIGVPGTVTCRVPVDLLKQSYTKKDGTSSSREFLFCPTNEVDLFFGDFVAGQGQGQGK